MAIQTSPLFTGFRGSVNKKMIFRQCGGKTVLSRFPDRSRVIYSEQQEQAQKRFSDAVDFARVVIKEPGLKDIYSVKASLLGFRSAWNLAIAEFMSETPLKIKKKKIRFDKSILRRSLGWNIPVKLYKYAEEPEHGILMVPPLRTTILTKVRISSIIKKMSCHSGERQNLLPLNLMAPRDSGQNRCVNETRSSKVSHPLGRRKYLVT